MCIVSWNILSTNHYQGNVLWFIWLLLLSWLNHFDDDIIIIIITVWRSFLDNYPIPMIIVVSLDTQIHSQMTNAKVNARKCFTFCLTYCNICCTNNLKIVGLTYTPVMDTQRNQWWIMCERNVLGRTYLKQPVMSFKQQMQSLMTENGQGYAFWTFRQPSLRE